MNYDPEYMSLFYRKNSYKIIFIFLGIQGVGTRAEFRLLARYNSYR